MHSAARKALHQWYKPALVSAATAAAYLEQRTSSTDEEEPQARASDSRGTNPSHHAWELLPPAIATVNTTSCSSLRSLFQGFGNLAGLSNPNDDEISIKRHNTVAMLERTAITTNNVENRYKIFWDTPLGRGMFGDVYEGVHRVTKEKVAIKKIPKKFTSDESFERELQNLLYLEKTGGHPSICLMREHFEQEDHFYLILDLIEGSEVFEHLYKHGAYSEQDAARFVRQVASALAFLHGIGLVHSDLKPENLMLSTKDTSKHPPTVKIVDFGCARRLPNENDPESLPPTTPTNLTPAYCPPEVLSEKVKDPRAVCDIQPSYDMWSLGVILFVVLTGAHPFDLNGKATDKDLEERIVSAGQGSSSSVLNTIRNSRATRKISDEAKSVLELLMEKDPSKRISAQDLLANPWVKGETASSRVISGSDRRLWDYRRHETKVASSIFKGLLSNSRKHGGSQEAKRTSILEMAFQDLDPGNTGYISTKELGGDTSLLSSDARLSLPELQHLLKNKMAQHHFPKGTVVYREGQKGDSMYFIQSGSVEVTFDQDGFQTTRHPGDFFGEDALRAATGTHNQTATCLSPVHVIEISREHFEKYLRDDEEVQMFMIESDYHRERERTRVILQLQERLRQKTYKPGQVIFKEGSRGHSLFMLERGNVDISAYGHKVRSLHLGEMTGEHAAYYANKPYNVTAKCMGPEPCVMELLDGKTLRQMALSNPDLSRSFRDCILRRDFKKAVVHMTNKDFPETEEELRLVFDAIVDTTGEGCIEFEQLRLAVTSWDSEYTEDDIRDMLKSLDLKGSGHLTWDDFRRVFNKFNDKY